MNAFMVWLFLFFTSKRNARGSPFKSMRNNKPNLERTLKSPFFVDVIVSQVREKYKIKKNKKIVVRVLCFAHIRVILLVCKTQ